MHFMEQLPIPGAIHLLYLNTNGGGLLPCLQVPQEELEDDLDHLEKQPHDDDKELNQEIHVYTSLMTV